METTPVGIAAALDGDAIIAGRNIAAVDADELIDLAEATDPDPTALCRVILERGLLTRYQLQQVAKGRGAELLVGPYLLLARLGLRACEIVAMALDDIDWEAGHRMVRGKGGQRAQMPLPAEVGRAIAVYLRKGRPSCASRRLFILSMRRGWVLLILPLSQHLSNAP